MKTRTSLMLIAVAVLALVAVQPVQAATYYWDKTSPMSTAGFGTAGSTWGTDAYWSASNAGTDASGITSPTTSDDLNFGYTTTGLAAGTVSVNGTVNAQSLTFASGSGAIVLSGGTAINLAAASTITVNNASDTISTPISGAATSLTKAGTGTLSLSGANTYTGATTLNAGTLTLSGAAGTINTSTGLTLNGGNLNMTNVAAEVAVDRVSSAGITSNGGTITWTNTSANNVAYAETIGSVALTSGQLNIVESTTQAGTGTSSQTLTLSGLTRTGATNTSAVTFSAASTGPQASGNKNMIVVTGGGTTTAGQIIGPWATTGTTAALQTDYAAYNANYVVPAAIAASAETTWANTTDAYTRNAGLGGTTLTATRNINALRSISAANSVTADNTTDTITLTSHTFANGDAVVFGAGTIPTGLTAGTVYFVRDVAANTFKVETTPGGGAINFTTNGATVTATGAVLLSSGNNLGTLGILNGVTNTLTIAATGTGAVTLPTTSADNLYVNTGSGAITITAPINDNTGALTLVKNGTGGTLTLSGTNTYSGGTVINAGTLSDLKTASLGTGPVTIAGNSTLAPAYGLFPILSNSLAVNNGVTLTINESTQYYGMQFSGVASGSGTITYGGGNNANTAPSFGLINANNTFTGTLQSAGGSAAIYVNSLPDSANPIKLNGGAFTLNSGTATPLLFNSRNITLSGTTSGGTINNNNATVTNTITINTDLLITGVGAKTLTLGGANTGANTFAGKIADGTGSVISLTKADAGNWTISGNMSHSGGVSATNNGTGQLTLSGTNTYSGTTTVNQKVIIKGKPALSPNTTFSMTSQTGYNPFLSLLMDDAGTVSLGNQVNPASLQTGAAANWTINVGNNGGGTTGSTLALGKFNFAAITDYRAAGATLNVTGANGYNLQFSSVDLNWGQAGAQGFNPTTAPLIITGTVKQVDGRPATGTSVGNVTLGTTAQTLSLGGTASGNLISGAIKNATDYDNASNLNALPLNVTKSSTSTWTLSGTNTYTGNTSITGGTLEIGGAGQLGSGNYAGNIAITAAKTFKYNSSAAQTLSGIIGTASAAGILVKDGAGTLTLTNANIYTGGTTVSNGKLLVNNTTGSGTGSGAVVVNSGGTLGGTGTIGGAVNILTGGTLAPGGSPGTLTVSNAIETWASGGKYAWQLLDATGTAGTDWDLAAVTGTGNLAVTATSGSPFNVVLQTLSSIGPDVQGTPLNWIATAPHSWMIASSATAITTWDVADGVASALFAIDATNFVGKHPTATFSVSKTGNDVYLNYVPEPATLALLGLGGLGLILSRKRK